MKEELAYSIIRVGTIGFPSGKNKQKESLPPTIGGKTKSGSDTDSQVPCWAYCNLERHF